MLYNYQARVREKYPDAEAVFAEPTRQIGPRATTERGGWRIHNAPGLGAIDLGAGGSEDDAWEDAWDRIEAALDCDPTVVDD
jgi:hypothetical protein